jgi:single-stranded DNA-binding protein
MASLGVSGIVRLTSNAEGRKSTNGTYYSFGIAAYRKYAKEGKQDVDFFEANFYSKKPSAALEASLCKGALIFIEGAYLYNDKFTGADGKEKNKYKIQIVAYEPLNVAAAARELKPEPIVKEEPKLTPKVVEKKIEVKEEIIPELEEEPVDEEEPPF